MNDKTTPDEHWRTIAGSTQALVRSQIEIGKLLNEVARQQRPLSLTFAGNDSLFISQLCYVDPAYNYILADYSSNQSANSALLAAPSASFNCGHPRGAMEFVAAHPVAAAHDGVQVVRFDFPEALQLSQRRAERRIDVIPELPLQCVASTVDERPFECQVVDLSCSGLGAIIHDDGPALQAGTVLKGCRIIHPSGVVVEADIEVRHCTRVTLPDGKSAWRTGCRFVGVPILIDELIRIFVLDMENPE